jgi:hypothetical protein
LCLLEENEDYGYCVTCDYDVETQTEADAACKLLGEEDA